MKKDTRITYRATTILGVRRDGKVVMGSDGQVTLEDTVMKHNARKIRTLMDGKIIVGFAGGVADAFALFERLEKKLEEYPENLPRAVVELAKDWRMDKVLRRLEAILGVMDSENSFIVSGGGEVIQPDDGIIAIGSGGPYALAAARALLKYTKLSAREIVEESLRIAAGICIYTNENLTIEEI